MAAPLQAAREAAQREAVIDAMRQARCRRDEAARLLGVSERYLYRLLSRYDLGDEIRTLEAGFGRRTWAPGRPAEDAV